MDPKATIIHWLHLMGAIFWIGGNAYQVFVLMPFLKSGQPPKEILKKISKRFIISSSIILIILVITGGLNFGYRVAGVEEVPGAYVSALAIKVFLIVAMGSVLVFGFMGSENEDSETPVPSLRHAKVSLVFGVLIVFIAAMLRHWRF